MTLHQTRILAITLILGLILILSLISILSLILILTLTLNLILPLNLTPSDVGLLNLLGAAGEPNVDSVQPAVAQEGYWDGRDRFGAAQTALGSSGAAPGHGAALRWLSLFTWTRSEIGGLQRSIKFCCNSLAIQQKFCNFLLRSSEHMLRSSSITCPR